MAVSTSLMEIEMKHPPSDSELCLSASIISQKRKAPAEDDFPPGTFKLPNTDSTADSADGTIDSQDHKGEYERGRITCESCGEGISFRDEDTGGFTVKHWDAHRLDCPNAPQQPPNPAMYTANSQTEITSPSLPGKRRRAKRTEEERIDYLRSDPYVAQFEAYRVLCASCDKWIRLRPNSTYCSIPWDAHRKSCLAKRVAKNPFPVDNRSAVFANDPTVRKFDAERVLCKNCEKWIQLGTDDTTQAIQKWMQHRTGCQQGASATHGPSSSISNVSAIPSVPPPSGNQLKLASLSSLPTPSPSVAANTPAPKVPSAFNLFPQPASPGSFKDLTPTNFPPTNESRRRNAEQRRTALCSDPLVREVEPNRVFCTLCNKWVQLRQDSSYCAYPWLQHRGKCLSRHEKRSQKEAELAALRAERVAMMKEELMRHDDGDDSDEPESEEGVESGDEEEKERRRAERREIRKKARVKAKEEAVLARLKRMEELERETLLDRRGRMGTSASDAEGDDDDMDLDIEEPQLADLDSSPGRIDFMARSIRYLFGTSYEHADDLTIASLVTFLNAGLPPDKHEDFDTAEVTRAAKTLHERGEVVFEGDVLRLSH